MDWLRHFLPRASDFLDPYAPDVEPSTHEESETTKTKTGCTLPALRGTPHKGPNPSDPDLKSRYRTTTPDVTGHQDILGHPPGPQANAVDVTPPPNTDHFPPRDSVLDECGQALMKESRGSKTVLEKMLEHVIPGARYNSSARDPPPRCCPGTRERILKDTGARIQDKDTRIIWLFGMAGSGKTAVMQTLAETYSSRGISATLFLSRDTRDDPNKIFTSLAYDFAVANPTYRHFIGEELASDPNFLSLSMAEQFRRLFIQPFLNHAVSDTPRWVVFLDGFDECRSNASQRKIIGLIRDSILLHPKPIPLLWVISSRPEIHLKASFAVVKKATTGFWEKEIPINAIQDVEQYLRTELGNISEDYSYCIPSSPWPPEEEVLELSNTCAGYFLFASLVIDYICDPSAASRLKSFSSPNPVPEGHPLTRSPLSSSQQEKRLHLVYTQVVSSIPKHILPRTGMIVGYYIFLKKNRPICPVPGTIGMEDLDLITVCNILGVEQHTAYAALHQISSLVIFPPPEEAGNFGIQFLHYSVYDFLHTNFPASGLAPGILGHYSRVLCQFGQGQGLRNICLSWPPDDGLDERQEALFEIARHGWAMILIKYCPEYTEGTIKSLGLRLIACSVGSQLTEFIECLTGKSYIKNVMGSPYNLSLNRFNLDRVFREMSTQHYGFRVVTSSTGATLIITDLYSTPTTGSSAPGRGQEWDPSNAHIELTKACAEGSNIPVRVLRMSKESCVIVGPIPGLDPLGEVYYILPF